MMFKVPVVFAVDCVGSIDAARRPPPPWMDVENSQCEC